MISRKSIKNITNISMNILNKINCFVIVHYRLYSKCVKFKTKYIIQFKRYDPDNL